MTITQSEVEAERILSLSESRDAGLPHPGLPRPLPPGESVVWQGAPNILSFARQVFHIGAVGAYFAILMVWTAVTGVADGATLDQVLADMLPLAALGGLVLAVLMLLARTMGRAAIYTITNKRIVFKIGAASVKTIDLPFKRIERVEVKADAKGRGNISICLKNDGKGTPYLLMWPHVRPWHVSWPQPTLRGLDDAKAVAEILAEKLHAALREEMSTVENAKADPESMTRYEANLKAVAEARATQERVHNARAIAAERRQRPYVLALFGLAIATLVTVAIIRVVAPPQPFHQVQEPLASYELSFVKEGETMRIVDMRDGATVAVMGPTGEGLLRNAVRGFERTRTMESLALSAPYKLIVWPEDKITLSDPLTDRHIPLTSFMSMRTGVLGELRALTFTDQ